MNGDFRAAVMFDADGDGPLAAELVVGGDFSLPTTGSSIDDLAIWNGVSWRRVLPLFVSASIRALTVFDFDGAGPNPPRLVIAGQFNQPGSLINIAMWNGQALQPIGTGLSGSITAVQVVDPDGDGPMGAVLYAAGPSLSAGGVPIPSRIARWNGTAWEDSGTSLSGQVNALASFDLDGPGPAGSFLIAGGTLTASGAGSNVAILNGTEWVPAGTGLNGEVRSLAVGDLDGSGPEPARLLACGTFSQSGPVTNLRGEAYFDGTRWQSLAPLNQQGVASTGRTIGAFDPDGAGGAPAQVFVAGSFRLPGSQVTHAVLRLEDGAWTSVVGSPYGGEVYGMTQLTLPGSAGPELLLLGTLVSNAPPGRSLRIARWDGEALEPFGAGLSGAISAMTTATIGGEGRVVASGGFAGVAGVPPQSVAVFDGSGWTPLGGAWLDSQPYVLSTFDPDEDGPMEEQVIAGGAFTTVPGGASAQYVARWTGAAWEAMGSGLPSFPRAFVAFDPDGAGPLPRMLMASGGLVSGGPGTPNYVFQWNGTAWSTLATFTSSNGPAFVEQVAAFDPDGDGPTPRQLAVFGFFNRVGTVFVNNAAVFDGAVWRPMGTGFPSNPLRSFTWDRLGDGREVVIACGSFLTAGGVPARGIAVWNGTAWSALGELGDGAGGTSYPLALATFDIDGDGPAPALLHATGNFTYADGVPVSGIARWNGQRWEPLGEGLTPGSGSALAVLPATAGRAARLCVGGGFTGAGGGPSAYFAQYGVVRCCAADFNADGYVNSSDLFDFLDVFFSLEGDADVNGDGFINSVDFFDVLSGLFNGC